MLRRRGFRRPLIAALIVVMLAACAWGAVSVIVGAGSPFAGQLTTVDVPSSNADLSNPQRGWFDSVDLTEPDTISAAEHDGVTITHSYLRLDAYRDRAIPARFLTKVGEGFSDLRADHLTVVLRVAYNFDGAGADASLARIKQHAAQLKPLLAKNSDVILSFEAGFMGAWGEWHDSTNGLTAPAAKAEILRTVLAAFPEDRDVALRYPDDIRTLLPKQVSAATAYSGSAAARVGNHEDCFLSSDPDDRGTWGQNGGSVAKDKALVASLGRYTIVGGETCGVSARTTCATALSQLSTLHFTYLNQQFDTAALQKLKDGGCYDEIGRRLGYRLAVSRVGFTPSLSLRGTLGLQLEVRNSGFAHVVNARPVYLVLTKGSRSVQVRLRTDIRTWAAGTTTTIREDVVLPASVSKGTWTLGLRMPDASAADRTSSASAIRLADADGWNAMTGTNALPAKVVVR